MDKIGTPKTSNKHEQGSIIPVKHDPTTVDNKKYSYEVVSDSDNLSPASDDDSWLSVFVNLLDKK